MYIKTLIFECTKITINLYYAMKKIELFTILSNFVSQ